MNDSLDNLSSQLAEFARIRDWEQFHTPKNLSMALIAEAAELVEHFQWLDAEQSQHLDDKKLEEVGHELADILIYLIRSADVLGIDILDAARKKIAINEMRYPIEIVRGDSRRAGEYE